jgi:alanine dehydrogenase
MTIGIPCEIKIDESRVGLVPVGADLLTRAGHRVVVETQAGVGSGFSDDDYRQVGATILPHAREVWAQSQMIIKVKEPQAVEYPWMRRSQVIFAYFHFAADIDLTRAALDRGIIAIAYETIRDTQGRLPLLTPMSEIAGKMSVQEGAKYLEKPMSGRGILLGGVPGVAPAEVLIIGAGVVGTNAAKVAAGLGAHVILMDTNLDRLRYLADVMPANVQTVYSDPHSIAYHLRSADLVIGAVLIPGALAPRLISRQHLTQMKPGSVFVDVAIDQGGCAETSRPTTHRDPTYTVEGVVHYCVTNIPGAVSRTSTLALCNATLPYAIRIATQGYVNAARDDKGLAAGINACEGKLTSRTVAEATSLPYQEFR